MDRDQTTDCHDEPSFLGEFEQMVLLAVLQVGAGAYAIPIRHELERRAGRRVARGALYTTLDRLEAKHLLASTLGEATAERGGRSKRVYHVTAAGRAALRRSRRALTALWQGLETVLEDSR